MAATALPKRSDVSRDDTWNLESIFASDADWQAAFTAIERDLPELEALRGTLGANDEALLTALRMRDEVGSRLEKLFVYANMRRDENTADGHYQALSDRVGTLSARFSKSTAFFRPEILALDDTTYNGFLADAEELQSYRVHLDDVRRLRPYIRNAEVEAVLSQASEATRGANTIFSMLNDADMKFPTITDEDGNEVELTKGRYTVLLESKDRRVREAAFRALYSTYQKLRNTLGATLSASIKRDLFYAQVRGYPSALEAALIPDDIPTSVYDNLITAVNNALPTLYRYYELRKKALGVDELRPYDMYVSMTPGKARVVSYDEARATIETALAPLGPDYAEVLHKGLYTDRWVDVQENEGKRSGAYSWGAYGTQPFVLMNWQSNLNNMYTLAHEFGHAMHSYYTRKAQPYIYGRYTIFVAEVASTCNEALLTAHLLQTTTDRDLKLEIVNQQIDEFRGTLFRQTMFAEFERETHRRAEAGEAMTTELLSSIYRELVTRYFGPGVALDDEVMLEWGRIPHFYTAFYVYKYATGIAAATALSHQLLTEGQPAVERYLDFLGGGSAKTSIELLKGAGVDMTTPEPVEQALQVFADLVDQMEALLAA